MCCFRNTFALTTLHCNVSCNFLVWLLERMSSLVSFKFKHFQPSDWLQSTSWATACVIATVGFKNNKESDWVRSPVDTSCIAEICETWLTLVLRDLRSDPLRWQWCVKCNCDQLLNVIQPRNIFPWKIGDLLVCQFFRHLLKFCSNNITVLF